MLESLIERYRRYLAEELNRSTLTVEGYLKDLQHYLDFCQGYLGLSLEPSTEDSPLVDMWLNDIMKSGYKASSTSRRLYAVKGFYKFLHKVGHLTHSPLVDQRPPRGEKALPVFVPSEDMERILQYDAESEDLASLRNHLILSVLYECGLRRSELLGLRDADVHIRERWLKVLGKGGKERIVYFGQSLAEEMERWRSMRDERFGQSELFFLSLRGKKMSISELYRLVRSSLAGVPNLARKGPHTLRHTFATDMLNSGADLKAIKELMGHSRLSTTVVYTHTSFKQIQQMYNAHHPRAKKDK